MNHRPILALGCLAMLWLGVTGFSKPAEPKWYSLFDGKSLTGWIPKFRGELLGVNYQDTFRVEKGVLKVDYNKYKAFDNRFGHLFFARKFRDYKLRIEYRFVGEQVSGGPGWAWRNNGVMVFSQHPASMRVEQDFPVSVEVQLLGGDGKNERHTANVCTPGTNIVQGGKLVTQHCIDSTSKTYHGDQWVTVELEVRGGAVTKHIIDGQVVFEYEKPQLDGRDADAKALGPDGTLLRDGHIAIQAESHPTEFRRIDIMELP